MKLGGDERVDIELGSWNLGGVGGEEGGSGYDQNALYPCMKFSKS